MERVVERGHVTAAVKRVRQNKGSPGMDGMTVDERLPWLVGRWVCLVKGGRTSWVKRTGRSARVDVRRGVLIQKGRSVVEAGGTDGPAGYRRTNVPEKRALCATRLLPPCDAPNPLRLNR